jgi:patatin-like phospholipase/acyl hydrolase
LTGVTLRVLSLDGGGIRGIVSVRVLVELEAVTGRPVAELFDLVAGTASGGILALGLAAPGDGGRPRHRASDLLELYVESGPHLFPAPDPMNRLRRLAGLGRVSGTAAAALTRLFGETPLGDALVDVIVPTFDLAESAPLIWLSDEFGPGLGPRMSEVALATSSAPTHFAAVPVELAGRTWSLTHGGVVANNPAPFAYAAALARADPAEVALLSLGVGTRATDSRGPRRAERAGGWPFGAARSFELQLEGSAEAGHQALDALLAAIGQRKRYWRVQPTLEAHADERVISSDPVALSYLADQFVAGLRPLLTDVADQIVP